MTRKPMGDQLEEVAGNQRGHGSTGEGSEQAGETSADDDQETPRGAIGGATDGNGGGWVLSPSSARNTVKKVEISRGKSIVSPRC